MDPSAFSAGDGRPSPTRRELQGPRPSPLRVSKDSFKIKKPPIAPQMHHPPLPQPYAAVSTQNRQTVVIYTVSPKVIHTTASDFMNLVQRLTGPSPRATESPAVAGRAGDVSPAARFASIEKASTSQSQSLRENNMVDTHESIMDILEGTNAQMSRFPGILTPGPATLPPVSPAGLFSPAVIDPFGLGCTNMFLQSPSILFSPTIVSPNYSLDLYNAFFDF